MKELICGRNSVFDAIKHKLPIKAIYTSRPNEISDKSIKVIHSRKDELDRMTKDNHQGFIAEIAEFNYHNINKVIEDMPKNVLILDHIQDQHNLGAIMRTANAFGVNYIILPKDRAAKITPTTLKVSSGGYVGMVITRVNSLIDAVTKLKGAGFWIYSTTLDNDSQDINEIQFNGPSVIILGSEEKGVSNTLLKHSDIKIHINMSGTVQSLNVSVAAGIILSKL